MDSMMVLLKATCDMYSDLRKLVTCGAGEPVVAEEDEETLWFKDCLNHTPLKDLLPAKCKQEAWQVECALNDEKTYKAVKAWIWLVYLQVIGQPYKNPNEQQFTTPARGRKECKNKKDAITVIANCLIRRFDCCLELAASYVGSTPDWSLQIRGDYKMVRG
jgi:hypothetical protein